MTDILLSVVIPAFNEAARIGSTLEKIKVFTREKLMALEVIVVDDCSTDDTVRIVEKQIAGFSEWKILRNEKNRGKGFSVKRGMLEARGRYCLFMDADSSTDINEATGFLERMSNEKTGADILVASRRVRGARLSVRQPIYREAAGRLFSILVRQLVLKGLLDTQCGFKMFTAQATKKIFPLQTIERFGFDVEILFIGRLLGYSIAEIPVTWTDSPQTKVHIIRDSLDMFLDLWRIRDNRRAGLYRIESGTR